MNALFDHIDEATFVAACRRLAIEPPERFWSLSSEEFSARIGAYLAECDAYIARMRARNDQMEAAARLRDQVPSGCDDVPLYELAQRGTIDMADFRVGIQTIMRTQAEEENDPDPADDNVDALLDALKAALGGSG